ncbi:tRNA:m(4)X modification enzyme TRM13 like protein [Turdus rufiventris]|nr:tRNA:m(4)X modification enzyme TRM13 like protein [Turdus rufiventris]
MAAPEPEPGRCAHFVLRKKRFCRMIPAPGRRFCGEHGHEEVYFVQDINAGLKDVAEIPEKQASILGNMEKLHLLGPGRCFVEFGAGRGKLSHWVDIALENVEGVQFLLVERATTRFKVDGKHKRRDSIFERLQVDIQHLCLNKVPILEKKRLPVVGIGKHLCGAATDLALRCLVESYTPCCDGEDEEPAPKRCRTAQTEVAPQKSAGSESTTEDHKPVAGIVIALCCHHKCDWRHYVGREFFKSVGLGPVEFHYFQRMSSWATCGMRETTSKASTSEDSEDQTNDTEEHEQTLSRTESGSDTLQGILSVEERKEIGCLCKRLIDHGRVEYLQQQGYQAALQYYTESAVSLENVLLTAVPNPSLIPEPNM